MALVVSERLPALGRIFINLEMKLSPAFWEETVSVTLKSTGRGMTSKPCFSNSATDRGMCMAEVTSRISLVSIFCS